MGRIDPRDPAHRTLSRGAAFVYVAPCAYEDLLKLGYSRDPLERLQSLHPRFFEVFDLDRAVLVATETVRDARALELRWRRLLVEHNAPAPLVMRAEAAGATEWYRGASAPLEAQLRMLEDAGHVVHRPARDWFERALRARMPLLYSWTDAMLTAADADPAAAPAALQQRVRDVLDACRWAGIALDEFLPSHVLAWYGHGAWS